MIFKQYHEILTGEKTETRRIFHEDKLDIITGFGGIDIVELRYKPTNRYPMGRKKIAVGDTLAVVPRRAQPCVHYRGLLEDEGSIQWFYAHTDPAYDDCTWLQWAKKQAEATGQPKDWSQMLLDLNWYRLQIQVDRIEVEPLRSISFQSALNEGVDRQGLSSFRDYSIPLKDNEATYSLASPIASYKTLWNKINPSLPWDSNPMAIAYTFQIVGEPDYYASKQMVTNTS